LVTSEDIGAKVSELSGMDVVARSER